MCSNCSGDYEDPDVTNPPAEDEPEPDTLGFGGNRS